MRTLLICHEDAALDREGLARWFESFSTFTGAVVIREPGSRLRTRIAREVTRVGWWRFLDVLAFRVFHRLRQAAGDRRWEARELARLRASYPDRRDAPEIVVSSPNSGDAQAFISEQTPDLVIARCKTMLSERIFSIPTLGTFVMHPGVCPEYRNAHGCFWAMAVTWRSRQRRDRRCCASIAASTQVRCSATSASMQMLRSRTSSRSIASCSNISTKFATSS
jgi:hypothetical protein